MGPELHMKVDLMQFQDREYLGMGTDDQLIDWDQPFQCMFLLLTIDVGPISIPPNKIIDRRGFRGRAAVIPIDRIDAASLSIT